MDLDFDKIYRTTLLAMKLNRFHPFIIKDKKWVLQVLILHGIVTLVFVLLIHCITQHDLKNNDFSSTCRNGTLCVLYCLSTFYYSVMLANQELLTSMIETMKKDYKETMKLPVDEQHVVIEYIRKSMWVCKQCFMVSIAGVSLYPVKNIIIYAYNYYNDDFKLVPLHDLTYPKIIEDNKENIYVYLTTYILIMYYGMHGAFMYTGFVPLGPVFILHSCGQLELIKRRLENLFTIYNDEEANEKLKDIICQLQDIYSFVEKTKVCFRVVYEVTLKASTIVLPIACYVVIEAFHTGEMRVELLAFIVSGVLISSTPFYYSDLLREKGEEVRLAVYFSRWEEGASRSARSTLLVVLFRALQPMAIRTMFRTVCLDALTDLFQQSYAIFNLMCAMWK